MTDELHLTKKDFKLEWFSGTGAGGQHRNKHRNCCRITHLETNMSEVGTESRSRIENQRTAFTRLAKRLIRYYYPGVSDREINNKVIRNYHSERNEVLDKISGHKESYDKVVNKGDLASMIEARRKQFE